MSTARPQVIVLGAGTMGAATCHDTMSPAMADLAVDGRTALPLGFLGLNCVLH